MNVATGIAIVLKYYVGAKCRQNNLYRQGK